jgi:hypothetical protein
VTTTTFNLPLYKLLLKVGATEAEAEAAATLDASHLATKADLAEAVATLKADLQKFILTAMGLLGLWMGILSLFARGR